MVYRGETGPVWSVGAGVIPAGWGRWDKMRWLEVSFTTSSYSMSRRQRGDAEAFQTPGRQGVSCLDRRWWWQLSPCRRSDVWMAEVQSGMGVRNQVVVLFACGLTAPESETQRAKSKWRGQLRPRA